MQEKRLNKKTKKVHIQGDDNKAPAGNPYFSPLTQTATAPLYPGAGMNGHIKKSFGIVWFSKMFMTSVSCIPWRAKEIFRDLQDWITGINFYNIDTNFEFFHHANA
jgi:hypothetical protein